ncbi:MAG: cell wall hydrolase, partial [Bacteroidales bacterium]
VAEALLALTLNLFFEARGENLNGQWAVADVTINRAKTPENVMDVVLAPSQFSWVKERLKPEDRNLQGLIALQEHILHSGKYQTQDIEAYKRAESIAHKALQADYKPRYRFNHFHVVGVYTDWGNGNGKRIGSHIFYRL